MSDKNRTAVIGGSEDGKTFLTTGLVRGQWRYRRRRGIVFDPWKGESDWGPSAWVTDDFAKFKRAVMNTKNCVVVWDEGTSTGGRDRENVDLFTAIRHYHPSFYFIGHRYDAMLPIMRGSLTDILLAVRDRDDADAWSKVMVDDQVRELATKLKRYEFLHKRKHVPPKILKFTPEQIRQGIRLD